MITKDELAKYVDNTNLKAFATIEDIAALAKESAAFGFATIAINPAQIERAVPLLEGSGVGITTTIGFPLGQNTIATKVFEAEEAVKLGATDIDYVINITELKAQNYGYILSEMKAITDAAHAGGKIAKVIFENAYLEKSEIQKLCEIALESGIDFVKTSTGFATPASGPIGATLEDVKLMKSVVGDQIGVKAAGGVRNIVDALNFIEAGATRLGTSAGKQIIEGLDDFEASQKVPDVSSCAY
jgi:deoxyribose-phosphate aldolase